MNVIITSPTGTAGSYAPDSPVKVAWTVTPTVDIGEFGVWVVDSEGGRLVGDMVPANGAGGWYAHNLPLSVPLGTGYTIAVMYRPTPGSGTWDIGDEGTATFEVVSVPVEKVRFYRRMWNGHSVCYRMKG